MGRFKTCGPWVCALILPALIGCERPSEREPAETSSASSGQSYPEAIKLMCEVDQRAKIADADPIERSTQRSEYIAENVKNPDGIEFRTIWSVKPAPDQARELSSEAKRVGIEDCKLADALARGD